VSSHPPADDRLAYLIAGELNRQLSCWPVALHLAEEVVRAPAVQFELARIGMAHASGEPCGDRNCAVCWQAHFSPHLTID
jgi:hypothetical protein